MEAKRPIKSNVTVEKVENITNSNLGAGSEDFIQYKNSRRIEMVRLKNMEIEHNAKLDRERFQEIRDANEAVAIERAIKNRQKRKKRKSVQKLVKKQKLN